MASCPICKSSPRPGWVCEDHSDEPWMHDGCRGAGAPCVCNPEGAKHWLDVISELPRGDGEPLH